MAEAGFRPCGAGCGQRPGGTGPGHRGARALAAQPCLAAEVFQEVSPPARRHRARGRPPPEGEARAGREAAALCDGHAPHVRRAPPSWPLDLRGRAGRVSFCTQAPEGALGAAPLCDGGRRGARGDAPVTPHGTSRTPFPCQWAGGPAEPWAWPHGRPQLPSGQPRALGTVFQNRPVGTENQAAEADTLCTASSVPGRFQHWLFLSESDCIFEEGTMAVCAGGLHRPSVAMATPTPGTPALSGARVWAGGSGV